MDHIADKVNVLPCDWWRPACFTSVEPGPHAEWFSDEPNQGQASFQIDGELMVTRDGVKDCGHLVAGCGMMGHGCFKRPPGTETEPWQQSGQPVFIDNQYSPVSQTLVVTKQLHLRHLSLWVAFLWSGSKCTDHRISPWESIWWWTASHYTLWSVGQSVVWSSVFCSNQWSTVKPWWARHLRLRRCHCFAENQRINALTRFVQC